MIKILYDNTKEMEDLNSGSMSQISWERLLPYLYMAFSTKSYERITGITVTGEGIKAKFETIKTQ